VSEILPARQSLPLCKLPSRFGALRHSSVNFNQQLNIMSKLLDYLNHLDKHADARAAHAADPGTSMTNFGLTQNEQDALMSGDKQRVADACGIALDAMPAIHTPNTPF
jgi:hypothetical protein